MRQKILSGVFAIRCLSCTAAGLWKPVLICLCLDFGLVFLVLSLRLGGLLLFSAGEKNVLSSREKGEEALFLPVPALLVFLFSPSQVQQDFLVL
jgi:hypothetical protein